MVACHPPFPLPPRNDPEMTPSAPPSPPPPAGAVLMPFTLNESFDDFAREHRLPDCAVAFLSRAGTWSARASRSGFAPSTMHAEFSDDPARAVQALLAAGAVRRVKAGIRITESPCWTLVNARDVHRDSERHEAEAEARRAKWRDDKQRQRDARKAGQRERIAAGVPAMSTGTNPDVHRENPANPGKPQVNGSDVQVDIARTSTRTTMTAASDDQDQDQSSGVSPVNARARDAPSPRTIARVTAGISKKLRRPATEADACRAIAEWDRRASTAGEVIHDPDRYYSTCIRREKDLDAITAPPPPAPPPEWLAPLHPPGLAVHVFEPDPSPFVAACARPGCGLGKANARHVKQEADTG